VPQKPNALQQLPVLHTAPPADAPHDDTVDGDGDSDGSGVDVLLTLVDDVTLMDGETVAVMLTDGVCVAVMLTDGVDVAELQKPNAVWQPVSMVQ
jgi:hypothetical protein